MSLLCTLSRASPNLCNPIFQPVLRQGLVLRFPGVGFPPELGIQMFCFDKKPVQAVVGRKSETLWNAGIQLLLGEFPKILPSCWPEQQSESWRKGGDTWHLSKHKAFRSEVTGGSCPSLLPVVRLRAGVPVFSSIPVSCWHLPAEINCSKASQCSIFSVPHSPSRARGCSSCPIAQVLVGSPQTRLFGGVRKWQEIWTPKSSAG